jgi:predicted HTH domain antitoxin
MPLIIPDETLKEAALNEREALVEFACRMFDAGRLALWLAARLAGLTRVLFEVELRARGISVYSPGPDDLADDLAALDRLGI